MYSNMQINRNKEGEKQKELSIETVLVMQGGGSLGAYEAGGYKDIKESIRRSS
jgi:predicted acylesterase/phospholipase RssA